MVWSAAVGVLLAIGYNATLPLLVSTSGVRATMERTLDGWSGGKSKINGEPEIRFWPELLLTLPSTTIESIGPDPRPLAEIGRITASFNPLSALLGDPTLEDISLVDPVITIERRADGTTNWQTPHWLAPPEAPVSARETPSETSPSSMAGCACSTARAAATTSTLPEFPARSNGPPSPSD
ncbi:AsmA family protein [Sinorhizobium fredii CCBAU 25509]|nr:AsmA family protein [Sinorhizobium fredii CCBAU 25509]